MYVSIIWTPPTALYSDSLEKIQNAQFLLCKKLADLQKKITKN